MPAVAQVKSVAPLKDLYDIGEIPPLGHVPDRMHAWVIRKERHGPPDKSMQLEIVPTWSIGEDEVLLLVMAGGVNYNGVWAGLGQPISTIDCLLYTSDAADDLLCVDLGGRRII